jgi:hypothetical protein
MQTATIAAKKGFRRETNDRCIHQTVEDFFIENHHRRPIMTRIQSVNILILLFTVVFAASGQEQRTVQLRDTAEIRLRLFDPNIPSIKLSLFPPPQIQITPEIYHRFLYESSALPAQQFTWDFKEKLDLTAPLKLQLADQEKYRTWHMILGSIQAGGTAYILYQHLKKYGIK